MEKQNRDLSVAKADLPIQNKMGRSAFATDKSLIGLNTYTFIYLNVYSHDINVPHLELACLVLGELSGEHEGVARWPREHLAGHLGTPGGHQGTPWRTPSGPPPSGTCSGQMAACSLAPSPVSTSSYKTS